MAVNDGDHEYPQKPGRGARVMVPSDRLANVTDSHHVFYTGADEAKHIARGAIRQVAIETLRGELGRDPESYEIESRAADIASGMARDFRRFL